MAHASPTRPDSAVTQHRRRLRERGLQRVEVQVPEQDAALLRSLAAALTDPKRAAALRPVLQAQFSPAPSRSLKASRAAAPFEEVDLERTREVGREVDFKELLDAMSISGDVVITRNGNAVARLVPPKGEANRERALAAARRIMERRKGITLGPDLTIRELIDEGRA